MIDQLIMKYRLFSSKILIVSLSVVVLVLAGAYALFFSALSKESAQTFVYVDEDDNLDSLIQKVEPKANAVAFQGFRLLAACGNLKEHIHRGGYDIGSSIGSFKAVRHFKRGMQTPVKLVIPSVRGVERLAGALGGKLMKDSLAWLNYLRDNGNCEAFGLDTTTITCLFIPNTYEVYWDTSIEKLLQKMQKESDHFWNADRQSRLSAAGLSRTEAITLASIIEEETANEQEKPMVAGMYINRLRQNMPLQADPTIKFALKRFDIKRIYNNMLSVKSPYNTYRNIGLPPGPIRIPTVKSIDAVLNYTHHDFIYMCAKEDFSGTHNFARTYAEHLQNAEKYSKALNDKGIN